MSDTNPKTGISTIADSTRNWEVETFIEQIWNDLDGVVARSIIHQVLKEVIPRYENARVKIYVPIFIRKETVARVRARLSGVSSDRRA